MSKVGYCPGGTILSDSPPSASFLAFSASARLSFWNSMYVPWSGRHTSFHVRFGAGDGP